MSAKSRFRKPCPNRRARVYGPPPEAWLIEVDGEPLLMDKWRALGMMITAEPGTEEYDAALTLASMVSLIMAEEIPGAPRIGGRAYMAEIRDMAAEGRLGVGPDGRAYLGEPVYDDAGEIARVRRYTRAERARLADEAA